MGEAKTAMKEVVEINANNSDTLTLEDRITMLNDDQRRIFDKMKYHLFPSKATLKIMHASVSLHFILSVTALLLLYMQLNGPF